MAISITKNVANFTPAFNSAILEATTNNTGSNFRFYVQIKDNANNVVVDGIRIPKQPNTNKMVLDLSPFLRSFVGRSFVEIYGDISQKKVFDYSVSIGEEYSLGWSYNDYEWNGSTTIYNGYTKLVGSTAHGFSVGDQIRIRQNDGGALKPQLETLAEVVEIPSSTQIVLNVLWVGSGAAVGGVVTYADERKTVVKDLATTGSKTAYLGSFDPKLWERGYFGNYFNSGGVVNPACSFMDLYVYGEFEFYLNAYLFQGQTIGKIIGKSSNGNEVYSEYITSAKTAGYMVTSDSDAYDDGETILDSNTKFIDFYFETEEGERVTNSVRVHILRGCAEKRQRVLFLDRLGSWLPFDFMLVTDKTTEAETETISNNKNKTEVIGANYSETLLLRTDKLNENQLEQFKVLVTSPAVKMLINGWWEDVEVVNRSTTTANSNQVKRKEVTLRILNKQNLAL